MDLGLAGKTALVTGSNRGTGAAIAKVLASEGANVLVHRLLEDAPDPTTDTILRQNGNAKAVCGDITTEGGADTLAHSLADQADSIDILVNNYGTAEAGQWIDLTAQEWIDIYEKNVLSATRCIERFLPAMRDKGWGRIIQIGTIGSFRPNARMPHYYSAKAALAAATVSLSKELAGTGITVNTISPGLIKTAEIEAHFRAMGERKGWGDDWTTIEKKALERSGSNPSGRIALPEEVGDLVAFVASPRADYINGENIRIDGGSIDSPF